MFMCSRYHIIDKLFFVCICIAVYKNILEKRVSLKMQKQPINMEKARVQTL